MGTFSGLKMFLQINSFCLVTACYMVHVVVLGIPVYKSFGQRSYDQKREMIDDPDQARTKRTAKIIGSAVMECMRAIQKLLKSSRPVISTRDHSLYERTGGYKQALRDFDELHPTDVISLKDKQFGRLGDMSISYHDKGWQGKPTVDIFQPVSSTGQGAQGKMITIIYD